MAGFLNMGGTGNGNQFWGDALYGLGRGLLSYASSRNPGQAGLAFGDAMQQAQAQREAQDYKKVQQRLLEIGLENQQRQQAQQAAEDAQKRQALQAYQSLVGGNVVGPNGPQLPSAPSQAVQQLPENVRALLPAMSPDQGMQFLTQYQMKQMEGPEKPASVQEYEYAKSQGFNGSIFDYQKQKAEAGRAPAQPREPRIPQIVTLVSPQGKPVSLQDSDPRIPSLLEGGFTKQQTSLFPQAPSGYSYNPDGSLSAIPGGPADKSSQPPTAEQALSAGFADRMTNSGQIIDQTGEAGTDTMQSALSSVPLVGNYLTSDKRQQLEQAERDFINAVLRRESGASISPTEFDNARKQYFPQPGDSEDVIKQKKKNRETVIEAMKRNAGPAYKPAGKSGDEKKRLTYNPQTGELE